MPRTRVDHPTTVAAVMAPVERPRPLLPRSCAPSQRNSLNLDSAANSKAELPPLCLSYQTWRDDDPRSVETDEPYAISADLPIH